MYGLCEKLNIITIKLSNLDDMEEVKLAFIHFLHLGLKMQLNNKKLI